MLDTLRKILDESVCLLLLAAIAMAAFYPVIIYDALPMDLSSILDEAPWASARPPVADAAPSDGLNLQERRYYPWYRHIAYSAARGESLWWNPFENGGMPFFALWESRCLSPFTLPFYLLDADKALQLSAILKVLVAGICAYYMARRFGFRSTLSLLVATTFSLSSTVFLSTTTPVSDVLPWFPLLIVFAERAALGHSHHWAAGALTIGLMLLGGAPAAAIALLALTLIFLALRLRSREPEKRSTKKALALVCFTVLLGLGLAAVQIVPWIDFAPHATGDTVLTGRGPASAVASALRIQNLAGLFAPERGLLLHVGLVGLFALGAWIALRRHAVAEQRQRVEALLATGVAGAGMVLAAAHLSPFSPVASLVACHGLLAGLPLAFALLAAAVAEEWVELDPEQCQDTLRRFIPLTVAILLAGILLAVLFWHRAQEPTGILAEKLALPVIVGAAFLFTMLYTLFHPSARLLGYALTFLTAATLLYSFSPSIPYTPSSLVFPDTSFVASLQGLRGRVAGGASMEHWPLSAHAIPQFGGTSGVAPRRQQLYREAALERPALLRRTGSTALVLTQEDFQGAFAPIRSQLNLQRAYETGAALVYDPAARPRVRMTYEWRNVADFDPALLSDDAPPLIERVLPPQTDAEQRAQAIIVEEHHDSVQIEVNETSPGILVLADTWAPGWRAEINGDPATVFPVDGAFRGVLVGAGSHQVRFFYRPFSRQLGITISIVAGLVTLAGYGLVFVRYLLRLKHEWEL